MSKVLITGITSGQGKLVARKLLHRRHPYEVVGVDIHPWDDRPRGIAMAMADVRKRKFEDVIRRERPEVIVHLGSVRHFKSHPALRHEVNVNGTRRLLDFGITHGVKQLVIVSSSYVYGALPENPYYMDEAFPLNSSRTYPEMRDLAEMDMLATAYLWHYPDITISVLRPTNVLGPTVRTAIGRYLRADYVPTVMGFNPMMQFVHEDDMAEAIVLTIERGARGAFNVVGPGAVPLHTAIDEVGSTPLPLPEVAVRSAIAMLFRWGLYAFPARAIDFAKYQCTLDGSRFREATGFTPRYSLGETFAAVRR
ncbi:NAD-dependent epimerase/dehydratase family protein [bacterium]|nr:NAD-dependent epimerase/dehydratase family protein [bacterium]